MTEADKKLMEEYEIFLTYTEVFTYKGFKYGSLKDALNYARLDKERGGK
jgi:hypothetical protein